MLAITLLVATANGSPLIVGGYQWVPNSSCRLFGDWVPIFEWCGGDHLSFGRFCSAGVLLFAFSLHPSQLQERGQIQPKASTYSPKVIIVLQRNVYLYSWNLAVFSRSLGSVGVVLLLDTPKVWFVLVRLYRS